MQDKVFSRNTINYVSFPVLNIKHCNTWRKCRAEENCNIIPQSAAVLVAVQKCSEAKEMILILLTEEWMGFLWKAHKKKQPSIFFPQFGLLSLFPAKTLFCHSDIYFERHSASRYNYFCLYI